MTYLQLVKNVLARLRENSVASVGDSTYAGLIGKFVNDGNAKWRMLSLGTLYRRKPQ